MSRVGRVVGVVSITALLTVGLPLAPIALAQEDPAPQDYPPPQAVGDNWYGTYVGRVDGTELAIAIVTDGKKVWAYACDGANTSAFFRGGLTGNSFLLSADNNGATISGAFREGDVQGVFTSPDGSISGAFTAERPVSGGGLFVSEFNTADGSRMALRWIVADDSTQRGNTETTTAGETAVTPAPPLDVPAAQQQGTVPVEVAGGPVPVNQVNPPTLSGPVPTSTAPPPPPPPPNPPLQAVTVTAKVDPGKADVNVPVRYQLTLTNPNQAEAKGAGVGVGFPPGLTFQPATEKTNCKGRFIAFPPGTTKPGEPQLVLSDVTLGPGASCTADVAVVASAPVAVDVVTNPPTAQGAPAGTPARARFVIGSTAVTPAPTTTTTKPPATTTTKPPATTTRPPATTTRPPATTTTTRPPATTTTTTTTRPPATTTTTRPPATTTTTRPPATTTTSPPTTTTSGATTATAPPAPRGAPSEPRNVRARPLELREGEGTARARVEVSFDPPADDGGSPITGYATSCVPGTNPFATEGQVFGSGGPETTQVVSRLTVGVEYICSAFAVNRVGASPTAVAENLVVVGPPSEPRNVRARPLELTGGTAQARVEVSFDPPADDGGSPVTGYATSCVPGIDPTATEGRVFGSGGPEASQVVSRLTVGVEYICSAFAANRAGAGPTAVAENLVVVGPPSEPRNVRARPLELREGDGTARARVEVSFDPPADDGGSPVTGYATSCVPGIDPTATEGRVFGSGGPATSQVVSRLTVGVEYICSAFAATRVGVGPTAVAQNTVVVGTPSEPRSVRARPLELREGEGTARARIEVSFDPPADDGGSPVTGYATSCVPGIDPSATEGRVSGPGGPDTTQVVTRLTVGVEYICSVFAANRVGTGPTAVAENVVVVGAPSEPRNVRARPLELREGEGTERARIEVSFDPPADNGGSPITGYATSCVPGTNPFATEGRVFGSGGPETTQVVSRLTVGVEYICSAFAANRVGVGPTAVAENLVVVGAPSEPRNVRARPLELREGDGTAQARVEVSFDPPADNGGSPVTGFATSCVPGIDPTATEGRVFGSGGPETTQVVSRLTVGVEYICSAFAANRVGTGPTAVADSTVTVGGTPSAPSPPSAPRDVVARALDGAGENPGQGRVEVSFKVPETDGGSPITGYTAKCVPGTDPTAVQGQTFADGKADARTVTLRRVQIGVEYSCSVRAVTATVEGPFGAAKNTVTVGLPSPPRDVTARALDGAGENPGQGRVEVSFTEPATAGSSPITGYTARCVPGTNPSPEFGTGQTFADGKADARTITLTRVQIGVEYSCSVRAVTATVEGPFGAAKNTVTVKGPPPPSAPRDVVARAVDGAGENPGQGRVEVSFKEPETEGGSPITGYTARCVPGTDPSPTVTEGQTFADGKADARTITLTRVQIGVEYICSVRAVTATVEGPFGNAKDTVTVGTPSEAPPPPLPSVPRDVVARAVDGEGENPGQGRVEVSFKAPETDGGSPITGYTAKCVPGTDPNAAQGQTFADGKADTRAITLKRVQIGVEYSCSVRAITAAVEGPFGNAENTVTVGVPSPPRAVEARALDGAGENPGQGRVEVSFKEPETDGGSAITGYTAKCVPGTDPNATQDQTLADGKADTRTVTLTRVEVGVEYSCSVSAVTKTVESSFGAAKNTVTVEASTPTTTTPSPTPPPATTGTEPEKPRSVVAEVGIAEAGDGAGDGRVRVSFEPPEKDGGSPITGFEVACTDNGNIQANADGAASPITVTGLPTPNTYECFVRAVNGVGPGETAKSNPVILPLPATVVVEPSAPQDVQAEVLPFRDDDGGGDGRIKVSFKAPESDGGAPITNFDAACTDNVNFSFNASGTASPITVPGVAAGFKYVCVVLAENAAGAGKAAKSNEVAVPLPPSVKLPPSAPRDVLAEALPPQPDDGAEDGRIKVSFRAPEKDGGAKITGFEVACGSGITAQANGNGTTSPITVTGLPVGLVYTCAVRAVNDVGPGDTAASKEVEVPLPPSVRLPPSVPRKVTAKALDPKAGDDPADGRIVVSFAPSEKDGGAPITDYEVACTDNDNFQKNASGLTSPITVAGLPSGLTYVCVVRAVNEVGPSNAVRSNDVRVPVPPVVPKLVATPPSGSAPLPVTLALSNPPEKIASWTLDFGDETPKVTGRGAVPSVPHTFVNKTDQPITLTAALALTPEGEKEKVLSLPVQVQPTGTVLAVDGTPDPKTFRRGSGGTIALAVRNPNVTPVAGPLTVSAPSSIKVTFAGTGWTCTDTTCTLPAGLEGLATAPQLVANVTTPADAPATFEVPFDVSAGVTANIQRIIRIPVVGLFANAGPDQTVDATIPGPDGNLVPTRVLLDAGASLGLDGTNQRFSWRRVSGQPRVDLDTSSDPTGRVATFDAPPVTGQTVYEFELTVGQGAVESKDRVRVTVFPRNQVPVLDKIKVSGLTTRQQKGGDALIPEGQGALELRPTASDPDGDQLTTSWRVLTPGVPNDKPNADTFKLQWPVQGVAQVIVEATVTDPRGAVDSATVTLGVPPDPLGLQVNAPARVAAGEQLTARATPSRTRGVQVRWSVVSGTAPSGFPKTNRNITFNAPDVLTTQVVTLEVTATETATGATASRQVSFEVQAGPALALSVPPTVSVDPGEEASIEATVEGPGNRTFEWTQTFGPDVDLTGADSRTVRFDAPDQATTIGLRLRATAGGATSTADTVVTVGEAAAVPSNRCGDGSIYDQLANGGTVVIAGIAVLTGVSAEGTTDECGQATLESIDVNLLDGLVIGDNLAGSFDDGGINLTAGNVRLPDSFRVPPIDLGSSPLEIALPDLAGPAGAPDIPCINWDAPFSSADFPFVPLPAGFTNAGGSLGASCDGVSLAANATAGGATFGVEAALADGGADATVSLANVPVLGGQASGTGTITVAPGGATTYDLTATVTNPSLPIPGLTLTTATARLTPDGLTVAADGSLGQGSGSLAVSMEGSFTNAGLSLAVEAGSDAPWEVGPGLTVEAANLVGTLNVDAAGAATVDLRLSVGGDWRPVPGLRVTGLSLQVANTAVPPECAIPAGGVWVRATGQGAIDIPGVAPIALGVEACLGVPTGGGVPPFSLRSTIGGAPWPIAPGVVIRDVAVSVSLVGGALTLQASGGATLLGLDLTARVLFLLPSGGGQPTVVVDAEGDLSGLGIPIPSAHVVFASAAVPDFELEPGVALDLPQGITGVGTIDLGQPIADLLNEAFSPPTPILPTVTVSISFGTVVEIKAAISLGGDGATLFMGCPGGGTGCDPTAPTTTRLALNSAFIRLVLGGSGGFSIGFGADGSLNLPPAEAGGPASPLDLHVEASIQPPARVSLAMFFEGQWQNAMGLSGLTMSNLGIQGSIDFSTTPVPLVTVGITGQVDRVPDPLADVLGLTNNGEPLRFTVNVDPLAPILELTLGVDNDQIVMRPLTAVGQPDALEVDFASVVIAPLGGTVGPVTYSPGVSIGFGANILDVPVHVNASVDIAAAHINGTVEIGSITIGGVRFEDTTVLLDITPTRFRETLCGGVHIGNTTLQGLLHIQAGSGGGGPATCGGVSLDTGGGSLGTLVARFRLNAASLPVGPVNVQQLTVDAQAELDALSGSFNATLNVTAQLNVLANNLNVDGTVKFNQAGLKELHVKAKGNVTVGGVQVTGNGTCPFPGATAGGSGACVQLDHAPGTATPFRFGLKGKLTAAGSTATVTGTIDQTQTSLSGSLNVPTLGSLTVSGTLVFGSGAQIANAAGTAVNASPGDWRVSGKFGTNKALAGGVSARWDFAAGRVSGGLFVRGSSSVSIGGANVALAGTFSSSGSGNLTYSLTGSSSASGGVDVNLGLTGAGAFNGLHDAIRLGVFAFPGLAPIGGRVSDERVPERMRGRMHFDASYDIEVTLTQSGLDIDEADIAAKVVYGERFDRDNNGSFSEEASSRRNTLVNFNLDASGIDEFFEMAVADAATRTKAATFCFAIFGEDFGDC